MYPVWYCELCVFCAFMQRNSSKYEKLHIERSNHKSTLIKIIKALETMITTTRGFPTLMFQNYHLQQDRQLEQLVLIDV